MKRDAVRGRGRLRGLKVDAEKQVGAIGVSERSIRQIEN
jgi:hypothetical protein